MDYEHEFDTELEDIDFHSIEVEVQGVFRNFADWIYRQIEEQWDYLNSDEAVDETITSNEYTFLESGSGGGDSSVITSFRHTSWSIRMGRIRVRLEGAKFGRLEVLHQEGKFWVCVCECGGLSLTETTRLTQGSTRSCGCLRDEMLVAMAWKHGASVRMTPEYVSWLSMRNRCLNDKSKHYSRYGGRGISICARWAEFRNFYEDMGSKPPGLTLDRRDNRKGYSKSNCRWASREEQSNNRECSVLRRLWGEEKSLAQWARDERCLVNYGALRKRVYHGWPLEQAMTWTAKRWPTERKR